MLETELWMTVADALMVLGLSVLTTILVTALIAYDRGFRAGYKWAFQKENEREHRGDS